MIFLERDRRRVLMEIMITIFVIIAIIIITISGFGVQGGSEFSETASYPEAQTSSNRMPNQQ